MQGACGKRPDSQVRDTRKDGLDRRCKRALQSAHTVDSGNLVPPGVPKT